ncbi:NUDIX domain-containing protein [Brevibacterium jeotgali]|uniref:ADP-ribose pyrophosphatase YjhB, NUDIX family n=1 Tax=Brevibacterium jeotgali TaxID=1262550 RepID=A0A2H1L5R3_9MICO|nr:NUDIX hydrolase [Brevibacterium jeotgali]TWB98914.1 ADP-ribose pyrophosphatase YjhB (NUDIX family) [Brevibacterium jeotgali]SMY12254.1 ADP-ribose pyrophosphatase YjhB, NUDIX family [Brevibacterium jeotgali]
MSSSEEARGRSSEEDTVPAGTSGPGATGELSQELREHLRARRRAGDGWVETPKGRFWGLFGAAGLLLHDPDRGVLLQHRVAWSAHGGTWGIPGGAIDAGETPLTGAIRECHEEAGVPQLDGADIRIIHTHVVDMEGWSYTTVVARTIAHLEEYVNDIESVELRWVPLSEVTDYRLHPGFAAAWPTLRGVLEG